MANSMVTGGFGFIGRCLSRMLVDKGDNVTIFDIVPGSPFLQDIVDKLDVRVGSLDNWVQVSSAVSENKIDTIYHVGACLSPLAEREPSIAFNSNVIGTFNLLEAAKIFGVKSIIFTSTQSSYQEGAAFVPDDYPQRPNTFYGTTKVCGERLGEIYWRKYGVNFRGVRYTIVNGPGRSGAAPGLVVVWTIQMPAVGRPFKVFLEPDTEMGTIYVKDAAKSLIDLNNADESKLTRRVYTLPSLIITPGQLVETVKKHIPDADLSYRISAKMMQEAHDFNLARRLDSSLAEQDWGAKLEYDLDKLVQDYIQDCKKYRELYDYPAPEL
ncbi:NAD-dependent epimerase/dehydratase family protein [Chloroflexota bacterium]